MCGWLAGFSMFACNVFRTKKWGKNIKEVFRSLCERVSLSEDFACRFWLKSFFFANLWDWVWS
jgi:hypothetical protein